MILTNIVFKFAICFLFPEDHKSMDSGGPSPGNHFQNNLNAITQAYQKQPDITPVQLAALLNIKVRQFGFCSMQGFVFN